MKKTKKKKTAVPPIKRNVQATNKKKILRYEPEEHEMPWFGRHFRFHDDYF